jgi:hypothetical protein
MFGKSGEFGELVRRSRGVYGKPQMRTNSDRIRYITVAFSGAFTAFAAVVILGFLGTMAYVEIVDADWGSMAGMAVFFRCGQIGMIVAILAFITLLKTYRTTGR